MRTKRSAAVLAAVYVAAAIGTAGVVSADPQNPDCPYAGADNPACAGQYPDDHDGVGDSDDHPGEDHHDGGRR